MRQESYYNTTQQSGGLLAGFKAKAKSQDHKILRLFREYGHALSPWQVHSLIFSDTDVPITSVRRSITTLQKQGKLRKTSEQVPGPLGRPEYRWVAV